MSDELRARRDELQKQYYEIRQDLEEVERKLVVESHNVVEALRGTRWIFHGDTDREDIAGYKAHQCYEFVWPGDDETLPEPIKLGLRAAGNSSTVDLGPIGGYSGVQLNEHDGRVTLRFNHYTRDSNYVEGGTPLQVAKELGLQLDFGVSFKDASDELRNAQEKLILVEAVIVKARVVLGAANVLS